MTKTRIKPKEPQTLTAFRLPPRSLNRLDSLAESADMTRSAVIRLAVDAVIEVGERKESDDKQRSS